MASKPVGIAELDFENGNVAENWKRWKQTMQLMLQGPLAEKNEKQKCGYFLLYVGQGGRDIYNTWTLETEERDKIQILFDKFEAYCNPKQNVTVVRYKFNTRSQSSDETIDQYVTELKRLAKDCSYGVLTEEMIRDRIVCGANNPQIKEKLLQAEALDLKKAMTIARGVEISTSQMKDLATEDGKVVHGMIKDKRGKSRVAEGNQSKSMTAPMCKNCGRKHGMKQACPAQGKICFKCNRPNHYSRMCRSKAVHEVEEVNNESDYVYEDGDFFIGMVNNEGEDEVMVKLVVEDFHTVKVKLDTGAQVNVMPVDVYKTLKREVDALKPTNARLTAYGGNKIDVLGRCQLKCKYKNIVRVLEFYVVNARAPSALSLKACQELSLIKVIMTVKSSESGDNGQIDQLLDEFQDVFSGQGCVAGEYAIQLKPEVKPVIHAARKVPVSLREKVKKELDRMEKLNIISKVDEPTEWVNSMVVVPKANGEVRICLDPRDLNAAIKREHYKMPTLDEVTSQLAGAQYFTVLDATSGYWVIPLSKESSVLTTFQTPYGRYRYLRMPFGICSAQEVFQKKMDVIFEGLPGVHVIVDDILVAGSTIVEHDEKLRATLARARENGIKFNPKKLQRCSDEVKFFGELLTKDGLKPDPNKVAAVRDMTAPKSKKELECQLGMFTYLSQYSPHLSQRTAVLRELVKKDSEWCWCSEHARAFTEIKGIITEVPGPVLQYYDPSKPVKVQVDASQTGLGAVVMQDGKPIAYASKALTTTQQAYAQIEKEALALVFGCEKFHHYLYGRDFIAETDHKPLEIIMKKPLQSVPMRLQRMRIRLQRYNVTVQYKPGKHIPVADTLSRSGARDSSVSDDDLGVDVFVDVILKHMPISDERLEEVRNATKSDSELQELQKHVKEGWPTTLKQTPVQTRPYWNCRDEIAEIGGILYKGQKIIIPKSLRQEMLKKIHTGHMGVQKCKERARDVLFWPGINKEIEELVAKCVTCQEYQTSQQREPLLPHDIPVRPWQMVATDLFFWNNTNYVVVVDYYSKYFEIAKLSNTKSTTVIQHTKSIFARHGIPEVVISDNGPQYSSQEYDEFARNWGFVHKTSSPTYPQSNGLAERTVQTVKNLLKKAKASGEDPYLSLLSYRNTPFTETGSPAQLLMNRRLRTDLPTTNKQLLPKLMNYHQARKTLEQRKREQKHYYDRSTRPLTPLCKDDPVRMSQKGKWEPAVVICPEDTPRSYRVRTPDGSTFRRNRRHLLQIPRPSSTSQTPVLTQETSINKAETTKVQHSESPVDVPVSQQPLSSPVTTRSGRVIRKPRRFGDYANN